MKLPLLLTSLVVMVLPTLVTAQDDSSTPAPGTYAVTFSLPSGGGGGFGVRKVLGSGANAGLELLLGYSRNSTDAQNGEVTRSRYHLGLAPDVRLYRGSAAPVIPFVEISGDVSYLGSDDDAWELQAGTGIGLGVEWFPLTSMSVSGSTGLRLQLARTENDLVTSNRLSLASVRSALRLNLYF